ncbi:MAG: 50S ribosomal protein L13 [Lentisphaerae bacterium]|nr:50S ribosomal protein L13 [Lentisphaerota bacterium]
MKSFLPKDPGTDRDWVLVDATDKSLGRLAARVAVILRGKDKPTFSPQVDTGEFVVVINAQKVKLTGRKEEQKLYSRYSGFRGGLKQVPASVVRERNPERMIKNAVRGMLPRNRLARSMFKRLKVYAGEDHPHAAQGPRKIEIE